MEKKIIRLKEVDSTNTFLKNLDTYDEDALTIAIADYQTAGRGQGVHTWESEPGKNLLLWWTRNISITSILQVPWPMTL